MTSPICTLSLSSHLPSSVIATKSASKCLRHASTTSSMNCTMWSLHQPTSMRAIEYRSTALTIHSLRILSICSRDNCRSSSIRLKRPTQGTKSRLSTLSTWVELINWPPVIATYWGGPRCSRMQLKSSRESCSSKALSTKAKWASTYLQCQVMSLQASASSIWCVTCLVSSCTTQTKTLRGSHRQESCRLTWARSTSRSRQSSYSKTWVNWLISSWSTKFSIPAHQVHQSKAKNLSSRQAWTLTHLRSISWLTITLSALFLSPCRSRLELTSLTLWQRSSRLDVVRTLSCCSSHS